MMKTKARYRSHRVSVLGLAFAAAIAIPGLSQADTRGEVVNSTLNIQTDAANFSQMRVVVVGSDGNTVHSETSTSPFYSWSIFGLPDGMYTWEAVTSETFAGDNSADAGGHQMIEQASGNFVVENGITVPETGDGSSIKSESAVEENVVPPVNWPGEGASLGGAAERLFGWLLELVVPTAHAFTIAEPVPTIFWNDTTHPSGVTTTIWETETQSSTTLTTYAITARDGAFFNLASFRMIPGSTSTQNSLIVETSGDLKFGNGVVRVDRSASSMLIGNAIVDDIAEGNIVIEDSASPEVILRDTAPVNDTSSEMELFSTTHRWNFNDGTGTTFSVVNWNLGAPASSLVLDTEGDIGLGTAAPAEPLHILDTAPQIRLDTGSIYWNIDGRSVGSAAGTGDFVLDFNNGTTTTFFAIEDETFCFGCLYIGNAITTAPSQGLHIRRDDGLAGVRVQETNATVAKRQMFELQNNGAVSFRFNDTSANRIWTFATTEFAPIGELVINDPVSPGREMFLDAGGNAIFEGTVTQNSDRAAKKDIVALDGREVLSKVMALPISKWSYKEDMPGRRHIGPMAQDFYALFEAGINEKSLTLGDATGVALAAIKGLGQEIQTRDAEIAAMKQEIDELRELVKRLTMSAELVAINN